MAGLSALPVVFLDFTIGDVPAGRVEIQLNTKSVPRTAENFRLLCTGEKGFGFKGFSFTPSSRDFASRGATFKRGMERWQGRVHGGKSTTKTLNSHAGAGTVSMVNDGQVDNNSSIFRISTGARRRPG